MTEETNSAVVVIDLLGGTSAAARFFNVQPPSVSEWKESGKIPPARVMYLRATRPDVYAAAEFCEDDEYVGTRQ